MPRVTNKVFINNFLQNINQNFRRVQEASQKISSGKKINKPSDDPNGIGRALRLKTRLSTMEQLDKNITMGNSWLGTAESAFAAINSQMIEANTTAVQYAGGVIDTTTAVNVIDNIMDDVIHFGNSSIESRFIFGGFKTNTAPFSSSLVYQGDNNDINNEFDFGVSLPVNISGSEFLANDLNPDVENATLLSSLNKGSGVSLGSISITDRTGNSATVDLSGFTTVSQVLSAISNEAGVNVTASLNSNGTGIAITDDNTSSVTAMLTVAEVGSGTTAADLGVLANRYGSIEGKDLDPAITSSTPLSLLDGGNGVSLSSIKIVNGAASGVATFTALTSSSTIADVISLIDASGVNVTAGINANGTGLTVTSATSTTIPIVSEVGSGNSASVLGLGGRKNILQTLQSLRDALEQNDKGAISATLDNMKLQIDNLSRLRGIIGGRVNRLDAGRSFLTKAKVELSGFLSDVEDTDIEEAALELVTFQNAYEVSLSSAAKIVNISLLDFLR